MAITALQLRTLALRARASAEGLTLHWPSDGEHDPATAARQCASVWAGLARAKDDPCAGLALSRTPDGSGGYTIQIRHADHAPIGASVTDTATGEALVEFAPDAIEAGRLASLCDAMPGPVCPLTDTQAATLWRLRPDAARSIWEANQWKEPDHA